MAKFGLNLRVTSGFVTDGTDDTYCLSAEDGTTHDDYPTTRGGFTFGYTDGDIVFPRGRDRDSGVNAKCAGINFVQNDAGKKNLRIDKTGSLKVRMAAGDVSGAQTLTIEVLDSAGSKFTIGPHTTSGAANFFDASDVERTSVADWVSNNAQSAAYTFADYVLVRIGAASGITNSTLAHVEVEEQAVADAVPQAWTQYRARRAA